MISDLWSRRKEKESLLFPLERLFLLLLQFIEKPAGVQTELVCGDVGLVIF